MNGDFDRKARIPVTEAMYSEAVVNEFWVATDDETKKAVEAAAEVDQSNLMSQNVSKRLSRSEKQYLKGASAHDLEEILQTYLNRAAQRQDVLKNSQQKMLRTERSTTKLLNNFHEYVQAYSGVVQLMNGVGAGYGDAAYGALTLFLVVAVNKTKTEELLDTMMPRLHQQYCRIKMVKKVYTSNRMKEHTALVYRLGIEFLYAAVRYYSMSMPRRMWHVIAKPPTIHLERKIADIQAAIEEMRMEMEVLDGIRLDGMEKTLGKVEEMTGVIADDVQALRLQTDNARLEFLQHLLDIRPDQTANSLKKYAADLSERFDDLKILPAFDVETELYKNADFQEWRQKPEPNLFILRGKTVAPSRTDLSWISPGAVKLVWEFKELFRDNPPLLLQYFCRVVDDWNKNDQKLPPRVVLSSFIFQILNSESGKKLLHDDRTYADFKDELNSAIKIAGERVTEGVKKLYDVLHRTLTRTGVKRVMIMVDRVDQIQGDLEKFIYPLLELMKSKEINVKAFLNFGSMQSLEQFDMGYILGERRIRSLVIDQDRV